MRRGFRDVAHLDDTTEANIVPRETPEEEPVEEWLNGRCKKCKKFVIDGQGIQELVNGEISRFCSRCFRPHCAEPWPVSGKV